MKYLSKSEEQTAEIAGEIAKHIKNGDVLCLRGDLGAGKTVFTRALIRKLTDTPALDVPSPTFTLVQTYDTDGADIWHFDLYRLEDSEEIYELGWEDAVSENIVIVEWPERLEGLAPRDRLELVFKNTGNETNHREITLLPHGSWMSRITDKGIAR